MDVNNIAQDICKWIKTYLDGTGLQSLVVGISGGIDSALSSTLCARTGIKTYVLNLPIQSKSNNTKLSSLHCQELVTKYKNVEYLEFDTTQVFNLLMSTLEPDNNIDALAAANTKSRMRMMILYYIASKYNGLVVGTGNKVEDFGVGFFTKYGDGGVDISPIADLTKTQVRAIAKALHVNAQILNAPPTDGLWEDSRTDEEQIGASYEELEWAMEHIENDPSHFSERQKEIMKIYTGFHHRNKHKMNAIPIYTLKTK